MWKNLYDAILQALTIEWADFIRINASEGNAVKTTFQAEVYQAIGLYAFLVPLAFSLFYYYYLNFRFGRYYSLLSWMVTLLLTCLTVALLTRWKTKVLLQYTDVDISKQILWISIINAFYAAVLFFLAAMIIKWKSPMGKRTPF